MTSDDNAHGAPSPFVESWIAEVAVRLNADAATAQRSTASPEPRRKALDLAMGRGRHARLLARHGFVTFGVDANCDAVRGAVAGSAAEGLTVRGWCADLTVSPLPIAAFDLVVVARYLQRNLFDAIKTSVRPGGLVIYETFTVAQLAHGAGPKSPDHLLRPGELRSLFGDWKIVFYEEADTPYEAVARLVAQRSLSG